MEIKYIDIHSHLNLPPLSETKDAILAKMRELGVATITVGTGLETSREAIKIAEENPGLCFATIGIHPCDADEENSDPLLPGEGGSRREPGEVRAELEELAKNKNVVAIGETGLDYFRDQSDETKQKQVELFKKHIHLAVKLNKPLMLHVRASKGSDDAYYDALEILKTYASGNFVEGGDAHFFEPGIGREQSRAHTEKEISANFHFFSGSRECMEKIIESGFTISVDGPITFSNDYNEMIRAVPIEKIMVETDAPFAAPTPHRGKSCEPWMVIEVAKKIAELKNLDLEQVRMQLLENSKKFFALDLQ